MSYIKRNWDLKLYFRDTVKNDDIEMGQVLRGDDNVVSFGPMRKKSALLSLSEISYNDMRKYIDKEFGNQVKKIEFLGPISNYKITAMCKDKKYKNDAFNAIAKKFTISKIKKIESSSDEGEIIDFEIIDSSPNDIYSTLGNLLDHSCCDFEVKEETPVGDYPSLIRQDNGAQKESLQKPKKRTSPSFKANPHAPWFEESYIEAEGNDGTISKYPFFPLPIDCLGVEMGIKKAAYEFDEAKKYTLKFRERGAKKNFVISGDLKTAEDTYSGNKLSISELGLDIKKRYNIKKDRQEKQEKKVAKRDRTSRKKSKK